MDKSNQKRYCFVRGSAIDKLRASPLFYQVPKVSAPNYLGTIEAIGHTRDCIEGAKPKIKFICSYHYTAEVNECTRIPENVYPTLNLNLGNCNYYSKDRCFCVPSATVPISIPSTSLLIGATTSTPHNSPPDAFMENQSRSTFIFSDLPELRTYSRKSKLHPDLSDSVVELFDSLNKVVDVVVSDDEEMVFNIDKLLKTNKDLESNEQLLLKTDNSETDTLKLLQENRELQNSKITLLQAKIDALGQTIANLKIGDQNRKRKIKNLEEKLKRRDPAICKYIQILQFRKSH